MVAGVILSVFILLVMVWGHYVLGRWVFNWIWEQKQAHRWSVIVAKQKARERGIFVKPL